MITKLLDLGSAMARIETKPGGYPQITIMRPSGGIEGGGFEPAQCICFGGQRALEDLRDALNESFPILKSS